MNDDALRIFIAEQDGWERWLSSTSNVNLVKPKPGEREHWQKKGAHRTRKPVTILPLKCPDYPRDLQAISNFIRSQPGEFQQRFQTALERRGKTENKLLCQLTAHDYAEAVLACSTLTICSLRRAGDIMALLPLLRAVHEQGTHVRLVVSKDFLPFLEGVSYVEPLGWDGDWEDSVAACNHYGAWNAQVFSKGVTMTAEEAKSSFAKIPWGRIGYTYNRYLPLVIDRRDSDRENALRKSLLKTALPRILVNLTGLSSPFPHAEVVRKKLAARYDGKAELVWLDTVKADRFYDLLGVMDHAACLVTVDTGTLWLAGASNIPVIAFTNGAGNLASPARGNTILRLPYSDALGRWEHVERLLDVVVTPEPANSDIALVHSEYTPADAETAARQAEARSSWPTLGARVVPFVGQRDSRSIGDSLALPFVRDMIEAALASGPESIIAIANNDIAFDPRLGKAVRKSCGVHGCYWAYRAIDAQGNTDQGGDFFAFTRTWWKLHQHFFPDMLLGRYWWDDILIRIMRWSGCDEQRRLIFHQPHKSADSHTGPAHDHNVKSAQQWLRQYDEGFFKPELKL